MATEKALSEIWAEKAGEKQLADIAQLNLELNGSGYFIPRFAVDGSVLASGQNKNQDDGYMQTMASQMLAEQRRQLYERSQQIIADAEKFSAGLDERQKDRWEKYEQFEKDLDDRTIKLDDGTHVYKDGDRFMVMNDAGEWEELSAERLQEAREREQALLVLGKNPTTVPEIMALWQYGTAIQNIDKGKAQYDADRQNYEQMHDGGELTQEDAESYRDNKEGQEAVFEQQEAGANELEGFLSSQQKKRYMNSEQTQDLEGYSQVTDDSFEGYGGNIADLREESDAVNIEKNTLTSNGLKASFSNAVVGRDNKPLDNEADIEKQTSLNKPLAFG